MEQKDGPKTGRKSTQTREDRLKAALKANMARRKAQARARGTGKTADDPAGKDE
ncbi:MULTISPECIES: hypothetical protein [Rhodobacterales]|uniref:hypothetical protein n=1 Tax=Rhodobacterales TaxID=204455 RepID=UPI0013ED1BF8|nr:hypothetical protein [Loktanella sp. IMCC34160]